MWLSGYTICSIVYSLHRKGHTAIKDILPALGLNYQISRAKIKIVETGNNSPWPASKKRFLIQRVIY